MLYVINENFVFADIFRQDNRSVLLLSHFGWIITQLAKWYINLVMFSGASCHRSTWHSRTMTGFWTQLLSFEKDGIFLMLHYRLHRLKTHSH